MRKLESSRNLTLSSPIKRLHRAEKILKKMRVVSLLLFVAAFSHGLTYDELEDQWLDQVLAGLSTENAGRVREEYVAERTLSWDYQNQTAWGGHCNNGTRQSPINIDVRM